MLPSNPFWRVRDMGTRLPYPKGCTRLPNSHASEFAPSAIADRLVENSEIFLLGGDSLRKPKNPNPPAEE